MTNTTNLWLRWSILSVAGLLLLTGCTGSATSAGAPALVSEDPITYNQVDVGFAQMMIPHHADAIAMARFLQGIDGVDPEILQLAADIDQAQTSENQHMNDWLQARGEQTVEAEELEFDTGAIEQATPEEIETGFLQQMIMHHSHGLGMARQAADLGESPTMIGLAEAMVNVQTQEINNMQNYLDN